ncbi:Putative bacteriochlorophyll 4-vinyl reductase [Sphingopyxis granuli]|uniref:Bacteriochlorophyll 4-vinyl reductase n=1 Tax=Sphingopyxis granuli TaxID=267128 RepID=A0AA86GMQ3_9SPHN|nr:Putative bacteriochlorophyll 4-vinyl reductase [Sphingopyxis granuli]
MGSRFFLGDYNDLILRSGPLPMEVLDALVQQWSAA